MGERKYLKQVNDVALMQFNKSGATLNVVVQLLDIYRLIDNYKNIYQYNHWYKYYKFCFEKQMMMMILFFLFNTT